MVETKVKILFKSGLHARPASIFVKKASGFISDIKLIKEGKAANAKSIIGVMALAATKGSEITLRIEGEDEKRAIEELMEFFLNEEA
jgi:phosphotransferase system HPr (HPr) family protein